MSSYFIQQILSLPTNIFINLYYNHSLKRLTIQNH